MSKSLADILGWEEEAVFKYGGRFFKVRHDMLLSSITGEQDEWYLDTSVVLNELSYLTKASKVEPKKYYLRHKFIGSMTRDFLNYLKSNEEFYLYTSGGISSYQTQFTEDEIEEIEASGFDLCNFEKVEVEDD